MTPENQIETDLGIIPLEEYQKQIEELKAQLQITAAEIFSPSLLNNQKHCAKLNKLAERVVMDTKNIDWAMLMKSGKIRKWTEVVRLSPSESKRIDSQLGEEVSDAVYLRLGPMALVMLQQTEIKQAGGGN